MSIPPLFEVYSVEDGNLFGILIRKQYTDGRIERAYVYLDNAEGLRLTRETLHANNIEEIRLDAKKRYHEKLLKELKSYADAAHETGDMSATRPLSQNYRGKEDFGGILTNIFERGNKNLADFLESNAVFKARILERKRSRNEVKGKARYFGVTSPERLLPDERFQYLRPIRDVLEIYEQSLKPENAQWFRKRGPIAADFVHKKFHPRHETLERLESLVFGNPVSLLQGEPATGKTVLALNLAYELYRKKEQVYYFDCDKERNFSRSSLVSDIGKITGIIIIENIHLAPQKFQSLCSDFKLDKDRHILFTCRPSLYDYQSSKSEDLSELPTLAIRPFEEVNKLIDHFVSDQLASPFPPEVLEEIQDVSSDSFWLLAYALMGYIASNGRGRPKDWIETGVTKDLHDLENICAGYPEILIAISTLYRIETLTAENYLTSHLGCSLDVLNALVREGQITRQQSSEGYVFYGLPHSALADAYWEFGQKYKWRMNISQYENFLYDYASSGAPNGLEAIVQAEEDRPRRKATALLADKGKLADIIANEQFVQTVARWLYTADTRIVARDNIIASLVHRVEEPAGDFGTVLNRN